MSNKNLNRKRDDQTLIYLKLKSLQLRNAHGHIDRSYTYNRY